MRGEGRRRGGIGMERGGKGKENRDRIGIPVFLFITLSNLRVVNFKTCQPLIINSINGTNNNIKPMTS